MLAGKVSRRAQVRSPRPSGRPDSGTLAFQWARHTRRLRRRRRRPSHHRCRGRSIVSASMYIRVTRSYDYVRTFVSTVPTYFFVSSRARASSHLRNCLCAIFCVYTHTC